MRATGKRTWDSTMSTSSVGRIDTPLLHQGLRMQTATSLWFGAITPFYKIVILVLYITLFFNSVEPVTGDESNMTWTVFWTPPVDETSSYPPLRSLHVSGVNGDDFIVFGGNHGDHSTVGPATIYSVVYSIQKILLLLLLIYDGCACWFDW